MMVSLWRCVAAMLRIHRVMVISVNASKTMTTCVMDTSTSGSWVSDCVHVRTCKMWRFHCVRHNKQTSWKKVRLNTCILSGPSTHMSAHTNTNVLFVVGAST